MNEARIKLAKVMGIKPTIISDLILNKYSFDPFTDANNDYAVLEWMRENHLEEFQNVLDGQRAWHYKIGDYARAACKVLGIEYV